MDRTNVLVTATSFPIDDFDWKGRFIERMVNGLSQYQDLQINLLAPSGSLPPYVKNEASAAELKLLNRILRQGGIAHLLRSNPLKAFLLGFMLVVRMNSACRRSTKTDLYHVNWLQNIIGIPNDRKPILVTVLGMDLSLLSIPGMKMILRYQFKRHPTILAPNNTWMISELETHFGDIAAIRDIVFGIDDKFYQLKRQLPEKKRKWLAVTRLTKNKLGPLFEWGKGLFRNNQDELHLIGPRQEPISVPEWVFYHGSMGLDDIREKWLPNIQGLVTLSTHNEGLPQIILEAMAAGIPVIASDLLAHRNVIQHRKNGWLVDSKESFHLAINFLSNSQNSLKLGAAAKATIKEKCGTWHDTAGKYRRAYAKLIAKGRK